MVQFRRSDSRSYTALRARSLSVRCRQRLPASDADLLYRSRLEIGAPTGAVLNELIERTPWRAESVVVWGKPYLQPRLTAWYGDEDARYEYSGLELDPLPWTPRLLAIKASVERAAGSRFNSVLLNYYRNERDSMGMHSDDEPELGAEPVIASLSLGEARTLVFRHRLRSQPKVHSHRAR